MEKSAQPGYSGHRKRIKEKYKLNGLKGWLDYEILEFALSYAIQRKDTKPVSKILIDKFKTINGVLNADLKELKKVKGISDHTALFIRFLRDVAVIYAEKNLYDRDLLSSPGLVYDYLKTSFKEIPDEEFKVLFVNSRNRLLAVETVHTGTVNKSVVYPRKIVERALYHHAIGVIAAHNHPGGSINPSDDDCAITKLIQSALKTIDIKLLDHIIIGGNNYFSFKEKGLL